ncbi:MAG: cytochrome c biogenesis CcdA family protein [Gemmatimonadaceae bacterium]
MEGTSFGIAVSFTAGLLSFLSPCVLPLVPSYVTFITGLSLEDVRHARRAALVHALLFVLGFTLIFLALGASATVIGRLLFAHRVWISRLGGALVILFGLYLLGAFQVGAFARERRVHLADKPVGYLGTVLVGVAFGAGWTPCIGPILGGILALTASTADLRHGLLLLGAYSLGLAIPFLLSAVAVERFLDAFRRLRPQLAWISRASGALLVGVGLLMVTSYFTRIAAMLQAWTPDVIRTRI